MNKLVFAVLAVFSAVVVPAFATQALPEGVKITGDKYFVYDLNVVPDSTGAILPVAVFTSIIWPIDVKLKKEWLIGGADSTVAVENIPEKFFWQGLLPKFKESKKLLVRKFTGIDRVDFEWQKNAGAKQTSYFMIISICLMFIVSLLSGLWLRIKDNDAVAVMAIVPITMVATFAAVAALTAAILTTTTLITLCGLLAFILAIVAAIGGVTTGLRQDFKGSVELSKISILLLTAAISFLTQSWFIFGILFGIEVVIFLTARYLKIKIGIAK